MGTTLEPPLDPTTPPAEVVLRCLARSSSSGRELATLSPDQWRAVIDVAVAHRVAPLVLQGLRGKTLLLPLPAEVRQTLSELYCWSAVASRRLYGELHELLAAFQAAGVDAIVLKGASLAELVYGDIALRPMADVDVLIREADLPRAGEILGDLGYAQGYSRFEPDYAEHHHMRPFRKTGAFPVELHRALTPREAPFQIDLDAVWDRASQARIAQVDTLVLSPEDLIRHLCLHLGYNHRFRSSLLHLCDIDAALAHHRDEIDWDRLTAAALRDGTARFIGCTLALARRILATEVSENVLAGLGYGPSDEEIVAALLAGYHDSSRRLPTGFRQLKRASGLAAKARALTSTIFPTPEVMARIYRIPARSKRLYAYYLFRPLELLLRRGGMVLAIASRTDRVRVALEQDDRRALIDRWIDGAVPRSDALPTFE